MNQLYDDRAVQMLRLTNENNDLKGQLIDLRREKANRQTE